MKNFSNPYLQRGRGAALLRREDGRTQLHVGETASPAAAL
jgi:hypothetical protein